jgi:CheY-like chemotaxis protein
LKHSIDADRAALPGTVSAGGGDSGMGPAAMSSPPKTILLAEDEQAVRSLIRRILENEGYRVLTAQSGVAALEIWELHPDEIDMIITDVVMPHLGGSGLAEELRNRNPGLKVLFMSGYTEDAIVQHGIRSNLINFIEKPFTPTALIRKTREILGG